MNKLRYFLFLLPAITACNTDDTLSDDETKNIISNFDLKVELHTKDHQQRDTISYIQYMTDAGHGEDKVYGTTDDKVLNYSIKTIINPDTDESITRYYNDRGEDGIWFTNDDITSGTIEYKMTGNLLQKIVSTPKSFYIDSDTRNIIYTPAKETVKLSINTNSKDYTFDKDENSFYQNQAAFENPPSHNRYESIKSEKIEDNQILTCHFSAPGDDMIFLTTDDVFEECIISKKNEHGNIESSISVIDSGEDVILNTADDFIHNTKEYFYTNENELEREVTHQFTTSHDIPDLENSFLNATFSLTISTTESSLIETYINIVNMYDYETNSYAEYADFLFATIEINGDKNIEKAYTGNIPIQFNADSTIDSLKMEQMITDMINNGEVLENRKLEQSKSTYEGPNETIVTTKRVEFNINNDQPIYTSKYISIFR